MSGINLDCIQENLGFITDRLSKIGEDLGGEDGAFDIGIKKEDCEVYYKIGQDVRNAVSLLKDAKATLDEQIRKEW